MEKLNPLLFFQRLTYIGLLLLLSFVLLNSCSTKQTAETDLESSELFAQATSAISVTPDVPTDIFTDGTPASQATLSQAATFAWNEFIALNWPYQVGFRDQANPSLNFGSQGGQVPLVWHTFRHKSEIFPGNSQPPPGYDPNAPDLGYNTPSPSYFYDPVKTKTSDGQVNPCSGTNSTSTPWINLDEKNEIGVATMYAGVAKSANYPDPQILFLAKANVKEYVYAAANQWYAGKNSFQTAKANTVNYIKHNQNTPPPSQGESLVSLPYGTIEIKTAWRRLSPAEKASGRFFSTTVRYYKGANDTPCYTDDEFGMLALHIIHKTPTAPYFIFATFEQADNILTTDGQPVEDVDGNVINNTDLTPTNPNFAVTNATPTSPQTFDPTSARSTPDNSLYFINTGHTDTTGLPEGTVTYNRRINSIPQEIIDANKQAHDMIASYNTSNGIQGSPWPFYKLVNVQYKPIDKQPGVDYTGSDRASYYLSNSVVESDYILQLFSGRFNRPLNSITDYDSASSIAYNAYYNGNFLMGGCMGCHGNATNKGTDYSFILGVPVSEPEFAEQVTMNEARLQKLKKFLAQ